MFILLFPCNLYQLIWAACRGPSSRSPCQAHVFGLWWQHLFVLHGSWNESTDRCPLTQVTAALQILIQSFWRPPHRVKPVSTHVRVGVSCLEGSCLGSVLGSHRHDVLNECEPQAYISICTGPWTFCEAGSAHTWPSWKFSPQPKWFLQRAPYKP